MPRGKYYGSKYASKQRPLWSLRRSRTVPAASGAGAAAPRTASGLRKYVKDIINDVKEDKVVCSDSGPQSLSSGTWFAMPAFQIGQGDTSINRDGNLVQGNYCKVRMSLVSPTDRVAYVRVMVVRHKATKAAWTTSELPADHLSCVTSSMRSHFSVIKDFVVPMNPRTTGASEDSRILFKELYFSDKTIKRFDTSATTTAEQGQVYICVLHGSNFSGGTDDPEVDMQAEYHFKEV